MHIVKNTCSKLMFFHIMAYSHCTYGRTTYLPVFSTPATYVYHQRDACTVYLLCVTQHSQSDINGKGQKIYRTV